MLLGKWEKDRRRSGIWIGMMTLLFSSSRETVVPALVEKCLGAMKAGTKQKATDVILLYAEIDVADPVVVRYLFLVKKKEAITHAISRNSFYPV